MHNVSASAVKINQGEGEKAIYIAAIKVKDLINEAQFQIDRWDPKKKNDADQGYQRVPAPAHVRSISKYALEKGSIFPSGIIISVRDPKSTVTFKEVSGGMGSITLQHPPFWIIDGQHRIKGLMEAAAHEEGEGWLDRELPAVVLAHFSKLEEVALFNTLNSTSKRVATDLAQQLMLDRAVKDESYRRGLKMTGEDWKVRALKLITKLNETDDSPWKGRVKFPNSEKTPRQVIGQNSLLTSLKPMYTSGYFESTRNIDHEYEVVKNFWDAIHTIFPESCVMQDESVILKTPGVFSLNTLLRAIMQRRGGAKEMVTKKSFEDLLEETFKDVDEYFWSSDNAEGASLYGSMKGFRILSDIFITKLDEALNTK